MTYSGNNRDELILTLRSNISIPQSEDGILGFIMSCVNLEKSISHHPSLTHMQDETGYLICRVMANNINSYMEVKVSERYHFYSLCN